MLQLITRPTATIAILLYHVILPEICGKKSSVEHKDSIKNGKVTIVVYLFLQNENGKYLI